jgi:hypothetical protein
MTEKTFPHKVSLHLAKTDPVLDDNGDRLPLPAGWQTWLNVMERQQV